MQDLMYAPILSDGSAESTYSAYNYVDWDSIDENIAKEAARCHRLLLADMTDD